MKVFDVWAEWCLPCKKFAPIFERVSEKFPNVDFVKINADSEENVNFLSFFGIRSIPTILIVSDSGEVVFQHAGILPEPSLEAVISNVISG